MDCSEIREMLSAYLDGEEDEREAVAVRSHLESCAGCRAVLEDWEAVDRLVAAVTVAPPKARLRAATATLSPPPHRIVPRQAPAPPPPRPRRRLASVLAAAALSVIAGTAVFAGLGSGEDPRKVTFTEPVAEPNEAAPSDLAEPVSKPEPQPTERPAEKPSTQPSEPGEPRWSRASDGELALIIEVRSNSVASGSSVDTMVGLMNVTDRAVSFIAPVESPIDVSLASANGNPVYRRSKAEGWSGELKEYVLQPGERVAEKVSFLAPDPGTYLLWSDCSCDRAYPRTQPNGASGAQQYQNGRDPFGDEDPEVGHSAVPRGALRTPPIKLTVYPARPA